MQDILGLLLGKWDMGRLAELRGKQKRLADRSLRQVRI